MTKKIFISYANQDRAFAEKVVKDLEKNGHEIWIDQQKLRHAVIWTQELTRAIIEYDCVLLLWSQHAKMSVTVLKEIVTARVLLKPIIPMIVEGEEKFPTLPKEIESLQGLNDPIYQKNFRELLNRLKVEEFSLTVPYPDNFENLHIPFDRNPYFEGRNSELVTLFVELYGLMGHKKSNLPRAISGLAGIGKTQLAVEFAYRFSILFPQGIYLIEAQKNDLTAEYTELASLLKLRRLRDESDKELARRILKTLNEMPQALLIMDNVTNETALEEWCPRGARSCAVLMTTRLPNLGSMINILTLKELDAKSALLLLSSRRKEMLTDSVESKAAEDICKLLGNLPLALELCAIYLNANPNITAQAYLQNLKSTNPLLDKALQGYKERFGNILRSTNTNVFSCFEMSYKKLERGKIDRYLFLISWFAEESINADFVISAYNDSEEGGWALNELKSTSLIRWEIDNRLIIHPLVGDFAKLLQKDGVKESYQQKFIEIMTRFIQSLKSASDIITITLEIAHIEYAIKLAEEFACQAELKILYSGYARYSGYIYEFDRQISFFEKVLTKLKKDYPQDYQEIGSIHTEIGKALKAKGNYNEALQAFQKALNYYEKVLEKNDPAIANLNFEIGNIHYELVQDNEAIRFFQKALETNRVTHTDDSPNLTMIIQALAKIDARQGDYQKAHTEFQKVLDLRIQYYKNRSENREDILASYFDICSLYIQQGNYHKASEYLEKAKGMAREMKLKEDPNNARILGLEGEIFFENAKYPHALNIFNDAFKIYRKLYGDNHPLIADLYIRLSHIHRREGDFDTALELAKKSLDINTNAYGSIHPSVAASLEAMVRVYYHKCLFDLSLSSLHSMLNVRKQYYGESNSVIGKTFHDYGSHYLRKGEFDEAIDYFKKSQNITERNLGRHHPGYFEGMIDIANGYFQKGEYNRALEQLEEAKGLVERIFGKTDHPLVARMLLAFSNVYRRRGEFTRAESYGKQSLEMKERIYGVAHPSVADSLDALISLYFHQYNFMEVEPSLKRALEIRETAYQANHPSIGRTFYSYGYYYLRRAEFDKAIESFKKALEISKTNFGEYHPDYFESLLDVECGYFRKGEYNTSLEYLMEAVRLVEPIFGIDDHPFVARIWVAFSHVYRRQGKFEEARQCAERSLAMKERIYGPDHPSVADALDAQINLYYHLYDFKHAEPALERALKIRQAAYSENSPQIGRTLHDFGFYHLRKGEFDEAIEYFKKAQNITEQNLGRHHPGYFEGMIEIANGYFQKGTYNRALEQLEEAKGLVEPIFGKTDHPLVARMLLAFSNVYRRRGEFVKAESYGKQSLEMKERIYGLNHPSVADSLDALISLYYHQYNFKDAELALKRALEIRETAYTENHPTIGKTFHDYGSYSFHKAEFDKAIDSFKTALEITKINFGEHHPEYFEGLLDLEKGYFRKGEYNTSLTYLEEAEKLVEPTFGIDDHPYIARMWTAFSHVYRRLGRFEEARQCAERSLAMKERIYGPDHPSVADALDAQINLYYHLYDFKHAEPALERALKIRQAAYSENSPQIGRTFHDFGSYHLRKGEFDEAIDYFKKAQNITERNFGRHHPGYFEGVIDIANGYFQKGEYNRALEQLEEAKGLVEPIFGKKDHPLVARMWLAFAEVHSRRSEFDKADKFVEKSLQMKLAIYGPNHPSVADALEVKERICYFRHDLENSPKLLEELMRIRKDAYPLDHPQVGKVYRNWGAYYLQKGQYSEAIKNIQKARDISQSTFGEYHPEVIERLTALASAYRLNGENETSLALLENASRLLKKVTTGTLQPVIAKLLTEYSHTYRKMGKFDKAEEYVEESIKLKKDIYEPNHPSLAESMQAKAKLLMARYKLKEAEKIIQQLLEMRKSIFGEKHPEVANTLNEMGILAIRREKYEDAINYLNQAYEIKQEKYNDKHPDLAKILVDMAEAYCNINEFDKSWECLNKAQNIDNSFVDFEHPYMARIQTGMGIILLMQKNHPAARERLEEAISIYEKNPKQDLVEHAEALENLALVYVELGDKEKALELLDQAFDKKKDMFGENHPAIAKTLLEQGQIYLTLKNYTAAANKLQRAWDICQKWPEIPDSFKKTVNKAFRKSERK